MVGTSTLTARADRRIRILGFSANCCGLHTKIAPDTKERVGDDFCLFQGSLNRTVRVRRIAQTGKCHGFNDQGLDILFLIERSRWDDLFPCRPNDLSPPSPRIPSPSADSLSLSVYEIPAANADVILQEPVCAPLPAASSAARVIEL